jgi:hypothetical protein
LSSSAEAKLVLSDAVWSTGSKPDLVNVQDRFAALERVVPVA